MSRLLIVLIAIMAVEGCAIIGVGSSATGTAVVVHEVRKERHMKLVDFTSHEYLRDHADSPCTEGEDEIIKSLPEFIKEKGPKGVDIAIKRFEDIYHNEAETDKIRASALYHLAVIHFRKKESNPRLGAYYLRKIYDEFPGQYECVFADSPWRNKMIEKLHIPEDLVQELYQKQRAEKQ